MEYSDAQHSPVFQTKDEKSIVIRVPKHVLKRANGVQAYCREVQPDSIKSITFYNGHQLLYEADHYPREAGVPMARHNLYQGEQLVGCYGVRNRSRFISSLGFIAMQVPH